MVRRISQVLGNKEKKEDADRRELTIWLDRESVRRLARLRGRLKGLDDSELMAFALKSLERQINRIIKRRVRRKIQAMEKKR